MIILLGVHARHLGVCFAPMTIIYFASASKQASLLAFSCFSRPWGNGRIAKLPAPPHAHNLLRACLISIEILTGTPA